VILYPKPLYQLLFIVLSLEIPQHTTHVLQPCVDRIIGVIVYSVFQKDVTDLLW